MIIYLDRLLVGYWWTLDKIGCCCVIVLIRKPRGGSTVTHYFIRFYILIIKFLFYARCLAKTMKIITISSHMGVKPLQLQTFPIFYYSKNKIVVNLIQKLFFKSSLRFRKKKHDRVVSRCFIRLLLNSDHWWLNYC